MKKTVSGLLFGLGTILAMSGVGVVANADTIDLPTAAPNSGYVAFDNQGKILESSSPIFVALSQEKHQTSPLARGVSNMAHSRWVYYSDHHGLGGYKWSHSNYYHRTEDHTSTAAVSGHDKTRRSASAHHYSYATAAGKGTAQAWYWAPYV